MKKIISLLTILFTITLISHAQQLGDTKSHVLAELGTPDQIENGQFIYVTEDSIVIVVTFQHGVVVRFGVTKRSTVEEYKTILMSNVKRRGKPDKFKETHDMIYAHWEGREATFVVAYGKPKKLVTLMVVRNENVQI